MFAAKSFGILVEGQGEGEEIANIANIGNRRNWKAAQPYANWGLIAEVHANLGCLGMTSLNSTPIWDTPGRGRGTQRSGDLS